MKTFNCNCGHKLFFDSTTCLNCGSAAAMCPVCNCVTDLIGDKPNKVVCGRGDCGAALHRCSNYVENGCNRGVSIDNVESGTICDYCRLTTVIPNLAIKGNRQKWTRLEAAKRRVLYTLDEIRLQFRPDGIQNGSHLSFEFRADGESLVHTGHQRGCITVNIREADSVAREAARVSFDEPQRTLVGHFRHELGHYFWDLLVKDQKEPEFRQVFGDERSPDYASALQSYHRNGPLLNWQSGFVSGYATMHPWEDFAETFGTYLDMIAVLHTASHFGIVHQGSTDIHQMIRDYQQIGVIANELNRDMGLVDLVPEVFVTSVVNKMRFIHQLVITQNSSPSTVTKLQPA